MGVSHSNWATKPLRVVLTQTFEDHQQETFDICFSPDGNILLSSDGEAVFFWRLETQGEWIWQKRFPCFAVAPRFSPDGTMFVYRDQAQTLHLSSLDGEELATFPYLKQANVDSAFSPDQQWLVSGDTSGHLVLWNLATSQFSSVSSQLTFHAPWQKAQWTPSFRQLLEEHISSANHFQFTPDGQKLVFVGASDEGYIHICDVDALKQRLFLKKTLDLVGIYDQKVAPSGKCVAITSRDDVYLYDLESFQQIAHVAGTREASYTLLAFSPDSQFLASSTFDGNIDIWSLHPFEQVVRFAAHPGLDLHSSAAIGGLDWSHTGYIATGGSSFFKHHPDRTDYTIKVWKVINDH